MLTESLSLLENRSSLPAIFSLLGLWLVLFIFFAILFVEVFGLTKWGGVETPVANYSSLGSAMVMLAFQSVGSVLSFLLCFMILTFDHGIARVGISICTISMLFFITECLVFGPYGLLSDLTYPRCTNSLVNKADTDCGSTPWAFGLFIAWNLLSMVIHSFFSSKGGFTDLASSIFS